MSSDSFYLANEGFEEFLKNIVMNCSDEHDITFEFKTLSEYRESKSGTIYIFQNVLSTLRIKVAVFLNKLTNETLNINMKNPIKNSKQYAYITFTGCTALVKEEPTLEPIEEKIEEKIPEQLQVLPSVPLEPTEVAEIGEYVEEIKTDVKPFEPEQGESILDTEELFEFDIEKIAIAEIPEWNRIYSDTDTIQTITTELQKYYYEKKIQKNTYNIGNESQSFYDMLKRYQAVNNDNAPIRDFKYTERYFSPYLELIKKGRYDSIPIYPIIINSKRVYNPDLITDNPDNSHEELRIQIANYIKLYRGLVKNEFKYKEFMNLVMNGGSVELNNEKIQLFPFFETYMTPEIEDMKNYKFYETTTIKPTNVVHLGLSTNHPINIYRSLYNEQKDIPSMNLPYIRTTNGLPITYQDQRSDTYYNEKTAEKPTTESCNGTMGSDMKFAQNNTMSDFFKSINKQPIEVNITDNKDPTRPPYEGERIYIVGFFIPSLNYIKNTINITELRDDNQNIKIYPKQPSIKNETSILKLDKDNLEVIESVDNFKWDDVNIEKDYMIFFNSNNSSSANNLSNEEFITLLEKIFPNIDTVVNHQYDRLKNCMNLLETQEILAEYGIDMNQVSIEHDKKLQLKQNFTEKLYSLKKTVETQKSKLIQLEKYIETVRSIYHELLLLKWKKSSVDVESQMKSILNSQTKIVLFMFLNYYVSDHVRCINIDSYLSYEIDDMVKIISKWFINNTPHVETLSEFYRWFSTQSIDVDDELISSLFDKYLKLFKLDKLLEFKTHGTGIYDQYFLRELQMVWNLNHNYNGGRHLLEIFQLIQIIKYQKFINESIETYAKEEYTNTIGAGEDTWDTLTEEQKIQFQPSQELIAKLKMEINDIFMTYENERKKYNLYNKCDKYRIIKIYNSLESLYKDNRPNIYYDTKFDTTPFDVKEYIKFRDNYCGNLSPMECAEKFKNILKKFYIFDSEIELNNKIDSVMTALKEPKHKSRRLVKDSDIALVIIDGKQDYYERIKNFWSPLREKGIKVDEINTDLLALNFKQVAMRINVSIDEPTMEGDEDCVNVPYESQMIPKALKEQYIKYISSSRKVSVLEKVLEFSKQVASDKTYLLNKLQRDYAHLEFILTQSEIDTVTKLDSLEVEDISIYPPQYITNELAKILAIEDTDTQYRELEIFLKQWGAEYNMNITKHLLNDNAMEEDIKNNEIIENQDNYPNNSPFSKLQTNLSTATYYFYNDRLAKVNVPIVCKHYSALIKSAYGSNTDRKNALDDVVKIWGVTTAAHHICKNCGEILRERDFSIMEGFDKDDRTARFREKVITDVDIMDSLEDTDIIPEESMDSKLRTTMKTTLRELTIVFKGFLSTIGLKFTIEDYINVLQWTFSNVNEAYYNERYNKTEEGLNAIFGKKSTDVAVNKKREQQKTILLKSFQLTFYVERLIASIVHLYMTSIPEYVMKGTGAERKVKTGYIIQSFHNNPMGALKYFIDKFTPLVKNKVNNIFAVLSYLLLDGSFKALYPKIYPNDETETAFYQYVKKSYDDYLEQLLINKRYQSYENYYNEKVKQQRQLVRYEKWSTFAPPLEYAETIPSYTDPMTKISDSIRNSNVLLYQYYNVIHNYPQTTIERSKYITYILFDNIRNNFIDALIQQEPNIDITYKNLRKLYENYSTIMVKDIQGIQYIISKVGGRDLQDYMDVNKALLTDALPEEHANIIKKNTENKWLQFNLIIHLETDDSGKTVGKRRVYKELEDMDYELLSSLYTNIPENQTIPEFYEDVLLIIC
jgi:hypothetical protein